MLRGSRCKSLFNFVSFKVGFRDTKTKTSIAKLSVILLFSVLFFEIKANSFLFIFPLDFFFVARNSLVVVEALPSLTLLPSPSRCVLYII